MNFTYPKKEKLCSKAIIDKLFTGNKPFYEFPLKFVFLLHELPENVPVQSIMTVSKKKFKRAYKRNLIKRRMKEAFRLNKNNLYDNAVTINKQLALIVIYNHSEILPFSDIETSMIKGIKRIVDYLNRLCLTNELN